MSPAVQAANFKKCSPEARAGLAARTETTSNDQRLAINKEGAPRGALFCLAEFLSLLPPRPLHPDARQSRARRASAGKAKDDFVPLCRRLRGPQKTRFWFSGVEIGAQHAERDGTINASVIQANMKSASDLSFRLTAPLRPRQLDKVTLCRAYLPVAIAKPEFLRHPAPERGPFAVGRLMFCGRIGQVKGGRKTLDSVFGFTKANFIGIGQKFL